MRFLKLELMLKLISCSDLTRSHVDMAGALVLQEEGNVDICTSLTRKGC